MPANSLPYSWPSRFKPVLLVDEKSARNAAAARGLEFTGLLGILAEAASRGKVNLPSAIDRLRQTNFRCSPELLKSTLDRVAKAK